MVGGEPAADEWVFPLPTANDTWIFDPETATWSELEITSAPGPVARPGLLYDPVRDRVLMFGGESGGSIVNDTLWALEGSAWSEVEVDVSPPARSGHVFAWDVEHDRAVLTGGVGRVLVPIAGGTSAEIAQLPDVWTFDPDSDTWTDQDVADTPIYLNRAFAVDQATSTLVVFGGELFDGRYEMGSSSYGFVDDLDRLSLADLVWR
jgi:N-acetylneuraminic acid mutarotase